MLCIVKVNLRLTPVRRERRQGFILSARRDAPGGRPGWSGCNPGSGPIPGPGNAATAYSHVAATRLRNRYRLINGERARPSRTGRALSKTIVPTNLHLTPERPIPAQSRIDSTLARSRRSAKSAPPPGLHEPTKGSAKPRSQVAHRPHHGRGGMAARIAGEVKIRGGARQRPRPAPPTTLLRLRPQAFALRCVGAAPQRPGPANPDASKRSTASRARGRSRADGRHWRGCRFPDP